MDDRRLEAADCKGRHGHIDVPLDRVNKQAGNHAVYSL